MLPRLLAIERILFSKLKLKKATLCMCMYSCVHLCTHSNAYALWKVATL